MSAGATIGAAYRDLRDAFRAADLPAPELDARMLVSEATGLSASQVIVEENRELDAAVMARLADMRGARLAHMPVGRIVGHREFWGLDFQLAPQTLEPRPDTEILVEAVLEMVDRKGLRDAPLRFADLGTGSGAILVALLSELPNAFGIGTDLSFEALCMARQNAQTNGVDDRAGFVRCSYAEALGRVKDGAGVDWIVSNPPYIRHAALAELDPEVRLHDPELALSGGTDGLDAYRAIVAQAAAHLQSCGGSLFLEIGYDQSRSVQEICHFSGFSELDVRRDLNARDRVVAAVM